MSARYSLLIIVIVAVILTVNSLWLHITQDKICVDCEYTDQKKLHLSK